MTDQERIKNAFKELRQLGYFARMKFKCCQSCGWAAVPEGKEKVVFYHNQDADNLKYGELIEYGMHLAWAGDGLEICNVLMNNGLDVEWNGASETRILVKHKGD